MVAVDGVSLALRRGEVLAVIGPSGAGKTTLMYLLAGLLKPSRGRVEVLGNSKISLLMQEYGYQLVYPTVREELLWAVGDAIEAKGAEELIEAVARRFRLEGLLHRKVFELSAGERKRLALAVVATPSPQVLLLDEPLADADAETEDVVKSLLAEVRAKGAAVVATNDIVTALELASRFVLMVKGRLLAEYGSVEELELNREKLRSLGVRTPLRLLSR